MKNKVSLINFIDLTLKEKKIILKWRNSSNIKQWMYDNNDISLDNHLEFIRKLQYSTDKLYFLVKSIDKYIGVVDFTNINNKNKSSEIGLYANIELKGIGDILLNSICEYAFSGLQLNYLIVEVFVDNNKAISLYKRFNFKKINQKVVNNKKVICMELINENR